MSSGVEEGYEMVIISHECRMERNLQQTERNVSSMKQRNSRIKRLPKFFSILKHIIGHKKKEIRVPSSL